MLQIDTQILCSQMISELQSLEDKTIINLFLAESFSNAKLSIKTNLVECKAGKVTPGKSLFEEFKYAKLKGKKQKIQKKYESAHIVTRLDECHNAIETTKTLISSLEEPIHVDLTCSIEAFSCLESYVSKTKYNCFCSRAFAKNNNKLISDFMIILSDAEVLFELNTFIIWFDSSKLKLTR